VSQVCTSSTSRRSLGPLRPLTRNDRARRSSLCGLQSRQPARRCFGRRRL
jgi:hypothetical protein